MTNKPQNTASLTNQERTSASLTWDEATFTWDEGAGTWDNPYSMTNKAQNTATVTNKAVS